MRDEEVKQTVASWLPFLSAIMLLAGCAGRSWPPTPPIGRGIIIRGDEEREELVQSTSLKDAPEPVLATILRAAERRAPRILSALARRDEGEAGFEEAKSAYWGDISFFIRDTQFNNDRLITPISPPISLGAIPVDDNIVSVGLTGRLPLDLNGKIGANVRQAGWSRDALEFEAKATRLNVLHAAAGFYRDLQRVDGLQGALLKQQASLAEQVRVAIESVKVGRLAEVEQHRIEAALADVDGQLATLKSRGTVAKARLESLLAGPTLPSGFPLPSILPKQLSPSPSQVANRPDLQAALARLRASAEAEEVALSRYKPELFLEGTLQHAAGASQQGNTIGQVSINLAMPIFSGGRRSAQVRAARSRRQKALQDLRTLEENARADCLSASALGTSARARLAAARQGFIAAQKTAISQRERFRVGRLSAADLVDTEAALARAEGQVAVAKVDVFSMEDRVRLCIGLEPNSYILEANDGKMK